MMVIPTPFPLNNLCYGFFEGRFERVYVNTANVVSLYHLNTNFACQYSRASRARGRRENSGGRNPEICAVTPSSSTHRYLSFTSFDTVSATTAICDQWLTSINEPQDFQRFIMLVSFPSRSTDTFPLCLITSPVLSGLNHTTRTYREMARHQTRLVLVKPEAASPRQPLSRHKLTTLSGSCERTYPRLQNEARD